jgi:hypothetical protein
MTASGSSEPVVPTSGIDAIEACVRDYVEGWYQGDTERIDRCFHPDLVKRILDPASATGELRVVTKQRMVELTAAGGGGDAGAEFEIVVHDISDTIASAQVLSAEYLDYLHMVKTPSGWRIANVLFRTLD